MRDISKIRIGNDIRLAVDLRQYLGDNNLEERKVYTPSDSDFEDIDNNPFVNKTYELYYPNQFGNNNNAVGEVVPMGNPVSIRSVKAILINMSKEQEIKDYLHKKTRFVSRFPIEPWFGAFDANPYNICNSGYPTWRAYPHHYMMMPYHGYGLRPEWGGIYKKLPRINHTEYLARVSATKYQNIVEVHFPAVDQLYTGRYKLVIVAKLYCPGFNQLNLKTITVDIPDVFELVGTSEEGVNTNIGINVSNIQDIYPDGIQYPLTPNDLFIDGGTYMDNLIALNRNDGRSISIDTSSATGWYESDEDITE